LGAGTTSLVAARLGLDSVGIDTSAEYIKLSEERLAADKLKRDEDEQKRIARLVKEAEKIAREPVNDVSCHNDTLVTVERKVK
jgi:DNA modification methylase